MNETIIISSLAGTAIFFLIVRRWRKYFKAVDAEQIGIVQRELLRTQLINGMELQAAIDAYLALASQGRFKFSAVECTAEFSTLESKLPKSVRDLFQGNRMVRRFDGDDYCVGVNYVKPSQFVQGNIAIGFDYGAYEEISVKLGYDEIVCVDASECSVAERATTIYPSIYHWLLISDDDFERQTD